MLLTSSLPNNIAVALVYAGGHHTRALNPKGSTLELKCLRLPVEYAAAAPGGNGPRDTWAPGAIKSAEL